MSTPAQSALHRPPVADLARFVRNVPDFPKPGIVFRDITTLLQNPGAFASAIDELTSAAHSAKPDAVVAIESRGFIFGAPVAERLGVALVPVRKFGKLPAAAFRESYALEYGEDSLEIHKDALQPGMRAVVMDDLLATGGTAIAACRLVEALNAHVVCVLFLIELAFLSGRERLRDYDVASLIRYETE
jgi:adenine phosphoribosyltransferase